MNEEWERVFGAVALALGLVILLSDLPSLWLGPFFGMVFLIAGLLCLARLVPGRRATGAAVLALGAVLFVPIVGLTAEALVAYEVVVGAGLGVFGILKIT